MSADRADAIPCEHDTLGCGDRTPHDEHTKVGDGRPCCCWPPRCGESGETITVKVTVDTDELREWAGRHADAGHHGVAHVLYKAAEDGEALTDQALREARQEAGAKALRDLADAIDSTGYGWTSVVDAERFKSRLRDRAARIARGEGR